MPTNTKLHAERNENGKLDVLLLDDNDLRRDFGENGQNGTQCEDTEAANAIQLSVEWRQRDERWLMFCSL